MSDLNLLEQFESAVIKEDVSVVEFAESDKYLGRVLYPRQKTLLRLLFLEELDDYDRAVIQEWTDDPEIEISPKLEERLTYLRDKGFNHFGTVQLIGGRRSSKGFITGIAMAFRLWKLTQLDDLHQHYHLPRGKEVEFSIVAASLDQAVARQFADAQDAILDCKPLQNQRLIGKVLAQSVSVNTPQDLRRARTLRSSGVKIDKDMASLIVQAHGTNSKTIRGSASIMFVFDEMAHLIGGESRMSDEELWNASIPSVRQFRQDAMIFANSSPYTKTGKFFELYEQAIELDPPEDGKPVYPDHFMLKFPSWALYKDWEKFPGCPPPQVFPPEEDPQLARDEQRDPDTFKVEYRAQFAEVENAFLRSEMVERMFDPAFNISILGYEPRPTHGAVAYARYKAHADPASTGPANFGIAVGHTETYRNPDTGIDEPHVVFDFIDAFYPEDFEDHTVDWLTVVPEFVRLINVYRPFEFTFDQFDSTMAIQVLTKELAQQQIGETIVREVTATANTNMRRALNFRAALNLGRVHAPHPDTFNPTATRNPIELVRNELKFLVEKNKRVDHQTIGPVKTKDIADCIMEVTDALIGDTVMSLQQGLTGGPQFGAQGGFGIGGSRGNTNLFPELSDIYTGKFAQRKLAEGMARDPARGLGHRERKQ
jgi:hypothetical protein